MVRVTNSHRFWTALALLLPLLYLQQLAPHHHALPEAATGHPGHHEDAVPHHHTHDHHHPDATDTESDAHHHHTLAAHLDLHALPLLPANPDADFDVAGVTPDAAPATATPGHGLRPPADSDPPPSRHASAPAAPRGPPRRA